MAEQNVVDLVDAHVPADQGLSSLGLLMQLGGSVLAAYAVLLTFLGLLFIGSSDTLWILIILGLSIARSFLQRSAGTQLLYGRAGEPGNRLAGINRYVNFALAQSVIIAALLATKLHLATTSALAVMVGLAAWPVTLGVLVRLPRFKRFDAELPMSEDKGFEGASILMTVLGLSGAIGGVTALLVMLEQPDSQLQKGAGVLMVLTVAMLVVRSIIHVQAGLSGLRETSIDRSVELANRYANFGVISSFCAGGALLLYVMSSAVSVFGMALISGLVWLLMTWPLILRRFFSDRQFADLLAGDAAPVHRRSPDAGLTSLGWLLFAYALFNASSAIPTLVMGGSGTLAELQQLFGLGGAAAGERSMWWSIGVIVLQGWAGYELVRMSPQSRIIATVFGAIGAGVALYTNWPLIEMFKHMHRVGANAIAIAPLAVALIMPVATLVLVNRKIAPTARARFRQKPAT